MRRPRKRSPGRALQISRPPPARPGCETPRPCRWCGGAARSPAHHSAAARRSSRRSPGVSLAAILSLAFGIAASCAVFSVVDALLLQPLPFADPASLVFATETTGPDHALNAVSGPDLVDWRSRAQSFAELGGFRRTQVTLTRLEAPERVDAAAVQPGVFSALRVPPVLGRTLVAADDLPGAP